ncbi:MULTISPECIES: type I secretion system permease/ATPase [unclassified Sphingomonas]|uniref:type I secretion system permease/ATPase n=1 Tax=unclassified Sphingomonas TaxID=196159 RepID=UPI001D0F7F5D|nr:MULTISPECIES: type I secretion system permease/ATPase [unclassified Sphingomonas]MCC2979972.1 type I secretion system permease/ATPase [Sphingomonas sp. IC4-52]MCD2314734.1 type I secretion system permease/ATPase [Sphingomonas sp. IC-11]
MSDHTLVPDPKPRFAPWLLEPMAENKRTYIKVAAAAVLINVFALVTSLFSMVIYDRVIPNNAMSSLVALSIGFGFVVIFDFVLKMLRAYFVDIAGADIDHQVGDRVFRKLLAIRLDHKKGSTGALAGLMRELEALRDFFASATMTALVDFPFLILTVVVIWAIGGKVVLVLLVIIPVVLLTAWATNPALERLTARTLREGLSKQSVLVETIGGLETVKASGAGPMLTDRWLGAVRQQSDSSLRQRLISSIAITVAGSASTISYAAVVIVGVNLIAARELTSGGLIACSLLAGRAIAPLAQISQLLARLSATRTAYRQINAMMEQPSEGPAGEPLQIASLSGKIEFRNVTFRYPGAAEPALQGVSFTIEPGERVALLGRVGSGKSTITRLILGLYPPEDGLVMVDGSDLRQIDPATLRAQIGVAMQDSVLMTGSVRENISLGRSGVDDTELLRAATLSGTHQFMGQIANGYDLKLADRGEGLSGGQRQSIAIARALAGRPPMLVFDEPSASMDAQTEQGLIERLQNEVQGRTMVLVTHRPPLLQLVQRIIVMERGRIAMDGPRDKVMQQLTRPKVA